MRRACKAKAYAGSFLSQEKQREKQADKIQQRDNG